MFADHVKCNWCDTESYISIGEEKCPNCHKTGFLQWVNEDELEMEVDNYGSINK